MHDDCDDEHGHHQKTLMANVKMRVNRLMMLMPMTVEVVVMSRVSREMPVVTLKISYWCSSYLTMVVVVVVRACWYMWLYVVCDLVLLASSLYFAYLS